MSEPREDWRAAARRVGHVCFAPALIDRAAKNAAFDRMRLTLPGLADRILLSGWTEAWASGVPADVLPSWAQPIDAAPPADSGPRGVKLLTADLLRTYPLELAVLKPRVRWTSLSEFGVAQRMSASPGEVLLEFSSAADAARALRQAIGHERLAAYVVTRGASSAYSASTWRLLRPSKGEATGRVLMSLNENSHNVPCFCSASSVDIILDELSSVLDD